MRKFTNESFSSFLPRKNSNRVDTDGNFSLVVNIAGVVSFLLSLSLITNSLLTMLDPLPRILPTEKDPKKNSKDQKYGMHYERQLFLDGSDETYVYSSDKFNTCCFKYYMEKKSDGRRFPNSSREANIHVGDNITQRIMLHGFHIILAIPGLFMPLLLYYAYYYKTHTLYIWWICWITLFNVHSLVEIFIIGIKLFHAIFLKGIHFWDIKDVPKYNHNYVVFRTLFNLAKEVAFPLTFYLSVVVLKQYRQLSEQFSREETSFSSPPTTMTVRCSSFSDGSPDADL